MNRMAYILGIAIMWAAYLTVFYFVHQWQFFQSVDVIFVAFAIAFGYFTIVLLSKAVRR